MAEARRGVDPKKRCVPANVSQRRGERVEKSEEDDETVVNPFDSLRPFFWARREGWESPRETSCESENPLKPPPRAADDDEDDEEEDTKEEVLLVHIFPLSRACRLILCSKRTKKRVR